MDGSALTVHERALATGLWGRIVIVEMAFGVLGAPRIVMGATLSTAIHPKGSAAKTATATAQVDIGAIRAKMSVPGGRLTLAVATAR